MNVDDDDIDADLAALDRGDNLEGSDEDVAAVAARDEAGRFAKADADKVAADLAAAADPEAVAAAEAAAAEAAAAEAAAAAAVDEPEVDADGKPIENAAFRLNKMRTQRDADRARAEAAEARLAALEAAAAKPEPAAKVDPIVAINTQLDELYEQVEDARADGDTKLAATLQRQIDAGNREIVKIEAEHIASAVTSVASENGRYDAMLDMIEAGVSAINPGSDDFNKDQVASLEFHVAAYEKMGILPTKALRQASKLLFGFDPLAAPEAKVVESPAAAPKPPAKKVDAGKAVDTQKRQPPSADELGANNDSTAINVNNLSDDEYAALPESKKAQMRGDFV